jgi:flagellar biogenesis protein FliO
MQKFIAFSFILLFLAAEVSAHGAVSPINNNQVQIFFAFIGMLTCLLGSLWLVTKLTTQRKATKARLNIVTAIPIGYQKRVVIVEMRGNSHQKK